jgi:aminotransferase
VTKIRSARRVSSFADSVFGEMTRLAKLHNAVNLSQGFPDFEAPQAIMDAACAAIQGEQNQYAPPYGTKAFRDAIAADFSLRYGVELVADEQVTVCCGSTEAMMASMLSCIDPATSDRPRAVLRELARRDPPAPAECHWMREPEWRFDPTAARRSPTGRGRSSSTRRTSDWQGVHATSCR